MSTALKNICRFVVGCAVLGILLESTGIVVEVLHDSGLVHGLEAGLSNLFGSPQRFDLPEPRAGVPLIWGLIAGVINSLTNVADIVAYVFLCRLMQHYLKGDVFSPQSLRQIHLIAIAMLASVLADPPCQALASFIQSWPLGPGNREVNVGIGSDAIIQLFWTAVVYIIARVMEQARGLADENARFV